MSVETKDINERPMTKLKRLAFINYIEDKTAYLIRFNSYFLVIYHEETRSEERFSSKENAIKHLLELNYIIDIKI